MSTICRKHLAIGLTVRGLSMIFLFIIPASRMDMVLRMIDVFGFHNLFLNNQKPITEGHIVPLVWFLYYSRLKISLSNCLCSTGLSLSHSLNCLPVSSVT